MKPSSEPTPCPICAVSLERRATGVPGAHGIVIEVCTRCLGVWIPSSSVRHLADPRAIAARAGAFGAGLRVILREIESAIYTDPLTGVRNRRSFDLALPAAIREANGRYRVSLLFMDLDGFKALNDTQGHQAGDDALKAFAQILMDSLRPMDHVSRYGGDEFAAILPETDHEAAKAVAARLGEIIARSHLPVTASIGVATYPRDGRTTEELLKAADAAMYRAKKGETRP